MKNIIAKPKRSLAHRDMVVESWLMVLLKLMNLKSCKRQEGYEKMNGYVQPTEHYSVSQMNEMLIHVATWMNAENTIRVKRKVICFFFSPPKSSKFYFLIQKVFWLPTMRQALFLELGIQQWTEQSSALVLVTLTWWLKYSKL